ncbi:MULTISPECIES: MFS transporter [unclassified Shinella]|uniref:MFS transporter n=1 Tax=unclassified Shinella TaxID=2643062 RepID=UPI00234F85E2|nr:MULTISPECIES: MFS transporter [unclassified Shinella]MCO5149565.1 MFS transporter [Shinella sp.]MDC7262530.1 MFS transporter [Shinella sp. HY16]MDC7269425.1 MFS transporter [Shinella sp. YZ44]
MTDATLFTPLRSRTGFRITLAGMAVMMAGASAPSPFYPLLQQEIGFSAATLTGIFAVYTVALLASLLVTGSLSDHVGRRPVISGGFALMALSLLLFWQAGDVGGLILARALQGIAAGLLLSALSATVVDLEPRDRPGSAAVWNSVVPLGGLAVGALAAGILMDATDMAEADVFGTLVVAYALFAAAIWLIPETAPRHEGVWASLRPRVGIPAAAARPFWRSAPAVIAGWATGGLYLSLGAPIVRHVFGAKDHVTQASVIVLLCAAGAVACYIARGHSSRRVTLYGTSALSIGTALTLAAINWQSLPAYLVALVIAGTGFGTCFYGVLRSIVPVVRPDERGELFAALFTLSYLAFGLPTLLAGIAVGMFGLTATTLGYGTLIVLFSATAGLLRRFGTSD